MLTTSESIALGLTFIVLGAVNVWRWYWKRRRA
jgi:hypothetical protein